MKFLNTLDSNFNYYAIDVDKKAENYCHKLFPKRLKKKQIYDLILVIGVVELNDDRENDYILNYIKKHSNLNNYYCYNRFIFIKKLKNIILLFYFIGNVSEYYKNINIIKIVCLIKNCKKEKITVLK